MPAEPTPVPRAPAPASAPGALVPYVAATKDLPEMSLLAVGLGVLLSVLFGSINGYLGLKIGLTVSASIPASVISMAVLRGLLRRGTVLENNMVHTIASAGESLAAGIIFTMPALIFLELNPTAFQMGLIGMTGGLLGILAMIPLRQRLMIEEHGALPFPEGTACAKVLVAGDAGGATARPVFLGLGVGALFRALMQGQGLSLWRSEAVFTSQALHKATVGFELSPLFLGVGYLVGPRIAAIMLAGGLTGFAVLIPFFDLAAGSRVGGFFGVAPDASAMEPMQLWSRYVRYVGAGGVAMGGLLSIVKVLPTIAGSFKAGLRGLGSARSAFMAVPRTERDIPLPMVLGGVVVLLLGIMILPQFPVGLVGGLLAVVFTFFFVVVSARMVGLIGSTSQPVSGMTITALLVTALVLSKTGHAGTAGMEATMIVGAVVCLAICLAGDMSQDLKCAAIVGATPWKVQMGEVVGTLSAAVRAGWFLLFLHAAYTLGSAELPAPQATLMATVVKGVYGGDLPWALLTLGAVLALLAELLGVSALAFAIGLYLPVTTSGALIFGGLLAWAMRRRSPDPAMLAARGEHGTLLASGLIAGDALMGIGLAAVAYLEARGTLPRGALAVREVDPGLGWVEQILPFVPFALVGWLFWRRMIRAASPRPGSPP